MADQEKVDAAQIGKMFVTKVEFAWVPGGEQYDDEKKKYVKKPGAWHISARLAEKAERYSEGQCMNIVVETGIGQKLAEVLLPVVIADASRKAQQLADDSKAMLAALGDRALACITDMSTQEAKKEQAE